MRLEVLKYLGDIMISFEYLDLYQANKMDKDLPITDKRKIMGLRHILVHDYDKINPATLYTIIIKNTELLKTEVAAIVKLHPPQGSLNLDD